MKIFTVIIIAAVLGYSSCSTYQANKQAELLTLPELGAVVQLKGDITYSAAAQVGTPNWESLAVTVQELPFNKDAYSTYSQRISRAGKIVSIPYNDTLRSKPKFIRLQLLDRIGLTDILNNQDNEQLRGYLAADSDHKLISSLDLALTESEITKFSQAQALQLSKDNYGTIVLQVLNGSEEETYYFSELPVFDYNYLSFCWGQDRYGKHTIENLAEKGDRCPKGTYLKPSKIKSDATYTKF